MDANNEMRGKILGLERNIFFAGITSFLTDTTTKMIYAVMPLFLLSIGASKTELSIIEGIAESTASILKALSGWWSDKIGRNKPFMVIGYAMTALLSRPVCSPIKLAGRDLSFSATCFMRSFILVLVGPVKQA